MSTLTLDEALKNVDSKFRDKIIESYHEIKNRYSKSLFNEEFDSTGLSIGKLCETTLRFLQHELTDTYIPFGQHISNFTDECNKLIGLPKTSGNESLRVIIPRSLNFLYTLRGKRGIGHVGGDVEANKIDTETIVRISDWIICELIRIYHNLSLEEAQSIVDKISEKSMPEIWEVAGKKRILKNGLSYREKVLLLLYQSNENFEFVTDLFDWAEYSNFSMFTKAVIAPLHKEKLVEFDQQTEIVHLSPIGIKEVEEKILIKIRT